MKLKVARELAASVWCQRKTSKIEMDTRLAEEFAKILVMCLPESKCKVTKKNLFATARRLMVKTFKDDPGFRGTYVANISMVIYDNLRCIKRKSVKIAVTNKIAEQIMERIFS